MVEPPLVATEPAPFRVGRIFVRALQITTCAFPQLFVLTALLGAPGIYLEWRATNGGTTPAFAVAAAPSAALDEQRLGPFLLLLGVTLVTGTVLQGLVSGIALRRLAHATSTIADALSLPFARMVTLLGIAVVTILVLALLIALPAALLVNTRSPIVLPALIVGTFLALRLSVGWLVAVPVAMAERTGVLLALARSVLLTSGLRWRIFSLLVVQSLTLALIALLLDRAATSLIGDGHAAFWLAVGGNLLAATGLGLVPTVAYVDLRRVRGEPDLVDLANVFE